MLEKPALTGFFLCILIKLVYKIYTKINKKKGREKWIVDPGTWLRNSPSGDF